MDAKLVSKLCMLTICKIWIGLGVQCMRMFCSSFIILVNERYWKRLKPVPLMSRCWTWRWGWGMRLMSLSIYTMASSSLSSKIKTTEPNVWKRQATESYWIMSRGWAVFPLLGGGDHWWDSCQMFYVYYSKILQCAVGNVKLTTKLHSGAVLVEVYSNPMAKQALSMMTWLDTEI